MKTAVLFPPLMAIKEKSFYDLYQQYPHVQRKFQEASDILSLDLVKHFFSEDERDINRGLVARPSIVTLSTALFEMLKSELGEISYYLGPSLGQMTAIHCSGSLDFPTTIQMVKSMVELEEQDEANKGYSVYFFYNILVEKLELAMQEVRQQGGYLEPCMYANHNQMIINGDIKRLEKLNQLVVPQGGLGVTIPFGPPGHCSLLQNVVDRFQEQFMPKAIFRDPDRPLVSNVDGNLLLTKEEVMNEIVGQYTRSVQWYRCLQRLWSDGVRRLVVLGPGNFITKSLQFTDIPFEVETYLTAEEINNKLKHVIKEEV